MPLKIVREKITRVEGAGAYVISDSPDPYNEKTHDGPAKIVIYSHPEKAQKRQKMGILPECKAMPIPDYKDARGQKTICICCPNKNGEDYSPIHKCYRSCLQCAQVEHISSIAIPLIGTGHRGYDIEKVTTIALSEILHFISDPDHPENEDLTVNLVVYKREEYDIALKIMTSKFFVPSIDVMISDDRVKDVEIPKTYRDEYHKSVKAKALKGSKSSEEAVPQKESPSFQARLEYYMNIKGMNEYDFQKKSMELVSRQTYYNIMTLKKHPSKRVALASALIIQLNFDDTQKLLQSAGYALDPENNTDDKYIAAQINSLDYSDKAMWDMLKPSSKKDKPLKKQPGTGSWKYARLQEYFENSTEDEITLTISEIEEIIGFELPASYKSKKTMWYPRSESRSPADCWAEKYKLEKIDLDNQTLTFNKIGP